MIDLVVGAVKASEFEASDTYATIETLDGAVYVLIPRNGPSADRLATIIKDFLSRSLTRTDKGTLRFEALNSVVQSYESDIEATLIQRLKDYASRGLSWDTVVGLAYHAASAQRSGKDGHKFLDDVLKTIAEEEAFSKEGGEAFEEGTKS